MKKVAILFAFVCAFVAPTFAQNATTPAPEAVKAEKVDKNDRREKRKKAANDMGLTADQKTKMKVVGQSLKGKMMAIKSDASLTKEQKKVQFSEVSKSHETEMRAILSPEQYTKWEQIIKQRRAEMGEKGGRKGRQKSDKDGQ